MCARIAVVLILLLSAFNTSGVNAQCDSAIVVSGWVFQENGAIVPAAMAVNRNSGGGAFVELDGSFLIKCIQETL